MFNKVNVPVSLTSEITQEYLGNYTDGKERNWKVIERGTYTVKDIHGKITQRNSLIQVRIEPNGFTLTAKSENVFYVEIPGWEDITFEFQKDPSSGQLNLLHKKAGATIASVFKVD